MLSAQESRVIQLRIGGTTTKAIAQKLDLKNHTVRSYLKSAHIKLGVHNLMGLLRLFGVDPGLKHQGQGRYEYLLDQLRFRPRQKDECWIWPFRLHKSGYAYIYHEGSKVLLHRLVLKLEGHVLSTARIKSCHSCDTPACFNPLHLWPGTQKDNLLDMRSKGRARDQKKV